MPIFFFLRLELRFFLRFFCVVLRKLAAVQLIYFKINTSVFYDFFFVPMSNRCALTNIVNKSQIKYAAQKKRTFHHFIV